MSTTSPSFIHPAFSRNFMALPHKGTIKVPESSRLVPSMHVKAELQADKVGPTIWPAKILYRQIQNLWRDQDRPTGFFRLRHWPLEDFRFKAKGRGGPPDDVFGTAVMRSRDTAHLRGVSQEAPVVLSNRLIAGSDDGNWAYSLAVRAFDASLETYNHYFRLVGFSDVAKVFNIDYQSPAHLVWRVALAIYGSGQYTAPQLNSLAILDRHAREWKPMGRDEFKFPAGMLLSFGPNDSIHIGAPEFTYTYPNDPALNVPFFRVKAYIDNIGREVLAIRLYRHPDSPEKLMPLSDDLIDKLLLPVLIKIENQIGRVPEGVEL